MIAADAFRDQPVLSGELVRLEPLSLAVLKDYLPALSDGQVTRLTGSHATFELAAITKWLETRGQQHHRADWAVLRAADGAFLGEAVLNEFEPENACANYRIWLAGPAVFGRGYGTEVTRLVLDYALDTVGLHRISLGVYDFNPRAQRVYEKCGFIAEGRRRDALCWDGEWHDEIVMAVLATDPR